MNEVVTTHYVRTEDINDGAEAWVALKDNRYQVGAFTPNKLYPLISIKTEFKNAWNQNIESEEFWIKDDNDDLIIPWEVHRGYFVKML
jgi:hypothetical protein